MLYELATEEPEASWSTAFTSRSSARKIILPPFLEDQREQIERSADPAAESACRLAYSHSPPIAPGRVNAQMTHTQSAITMIAHSG